jgi:hypothetical protein
VLDEIGALSYPMWLSDTVPFLPVLDLTCITISGRNYLDDAVANSTLATVTGFLDAIMIGCESDNLLFSGGYDNDKQEMGMNIIFEANESGNL